MKFNIITSFPKSGNTWLRYIIYELFFNLQNEENNNSLNIQKFIKRKSNINPEKIIWKLH